MFANEVKYFHANVYMGVTDYWKAFLNELFFIVISRFLDVDHLISSLIQIPKREGVKVFERKIAEVIYLKHTIELVVALDQALKDGDNELFKAYSQVNLWF